MSAPTISRPNRWMALCLAGYLVLLVTARLALPDEPSAAEGAPFAIVAAVLALGVLLLGPLDAVRRTDDLDRHVLLSSTSVAFFTTMAVAVTWGLFESFADAPRPSAWLTWSVGMGTWFVASVVARRRLA